MTSTQNSRETMQMNCEVPASSLKSNGHQQCNGSPMEGSIEPKNDSNFLELDHNKLLESLIEPNKKPAYIGSWSLHPANIKKAHLCPLNNIEGQFYPYFLNNRVQYAPFTVFPQSYPCDYQHQEFHYFVVIDFEATCDKERNPHPQEIIEFPSVIVSCLTGQLEACFQTYVRPTCNRLLSDFCKDLTGIQQFQVDRGVTLSEALVRHDKWLEMKGIKNANFAVVTWSNWDCRVMLESECRFKKIRKPSYFNRWINLKVPFCEVFGGAKCNLKEAVQMAGLSWQGRAHCGLDDARNTARLLAVMMHRGFKFSITNSLICHPTDHHAAFTWKSPTGHIPFPPYHHHLPPQKAKNLHFIPLFHPCCFCGVKSSKGMVRKPGPKQGSRFFGCGNWTSARGALCQYFEWA